VYYVLLVHCEPHKYIRICRVIIECDAFLFGEACSMHRKEVLMNFWRETLKERVHFEKVSLDDKVKPKWVIHIMKGRSLGPCSSRERKRERGCGVML